MLYRFCSFFLSFFLIFGILPSNAGTIIINPTQIHITKPFASNIINLSNTGNTEVRMQVFVYSWSQKPGERMITKPTDEILAYPSLISLPPGANKQIRVGVTKPLSILEKTYRIVFREIKSPEDNHEVGTHITLLTNIDIPIFVSTEQSPEPKPVIEISSANVSTNKSTITLRNTSSIHEQLKTIEFSAYDEQNKIITKSSKDGWYILAGNEQSYDFVLPNNICKEIKTIGIVIHNRNNTSITLAANPTINCRGK